ncbi:VOC family protein [Dermacoccus sp. PAMC28757]|uniref:VOC family protein n=1 Tax=Dermacoccus sp. PAMC28757 TaxID=2762331 RepID=UPI00351C2497
MRGGERYASEWVPTCAGWGTPRPAFLEMPLVGLLLPHTLRASNSAPSRCRRMPRSPAERPSHQRHAHSWHTARAARWSCTQCDVRSRKLARSSATCSRTCACSGATTSQVGNTVWNTSDSRADIESVSTMDDFPTLLHTALDARDCRGLAEFYRRLLGLRYRDGDEPPDESGKDSADWLVLVTPSGQRVLAVQRKLDTRQPTWPSEEVPMQMHMDFRVPSVASLHRHRVRAEELGARVLWDRSRDDSEPLFVMADPAGHPFCLLVQ